MESEHRSLTLQSIIEQSDYAMVITTSDLDAPGPVFVHVNAAFTRMTGYTREEVLGATPRILQGSNTDRSVLDRLKANLRAGDSFEGCTWNYRKDGTPYLVEWTISRLRSEREGIDYFFSVQRDLSERYQTQGNPGRQARRLAAVLNSAGSNYDLATGALNYGGMIFRLQRFIDEAEAACAATGLVSLQFRRLQRVDQAFGVEAMVNLLSDIGERLDSRLEAGESLARHHEHNFAILIPVGADAASEADRHLMARARTLVAAVREEGFPVAGNAYHPQVGAGVACGPSDSRHAHELAVLADEAAQRAPTTCQDATRWRDRNNKENTRQQIVLEANLHRAVIERELVLFYQPIIDLTRGEVVGAETLARWPQPEGHSPIGPDCFIPVVEELGLMDRLGMQVFEDACRQLRRWQQCPGNKAFWVSVNLAPSQLRDPTLIDRFIAITQKTGVSPTCVKLELTEDALEHGLSEVSNILADLAAVGFPLALDDFGKGYSSLGRLIDMPFNIIKVDKTFVWQTPDGRGTGVVTSLSELSGHLQLDALGEGVETAAQEAFLREYNYRYAQGFYYAKPMAAADFAVWAGWPRV